MHRGELLSLPTIIRISVEDPDLNTKHVCRFPDQERRDSTIHLSCSYHPITEVKHVSPLRAGSKSGQSRLPCDRTASQQLCVCGKQNCRTIQGKISCVGFSIDVPVALPLYTFQSAPLLAVGFWCRDGILEMISTSLVAQV